MPPEIAGRDHPSSAAFRLSQRLPGILRPVRDETFTKFKVGFAGIRRAEWDKWDKVAHARRVVRATDRVAPARRVVRATDRVTPARRVVRATYRVTRARQIRSCARHMGSHARVPGYVGGGTAGRTLTLSIPQGRREGRLARSRSPPPAVSGRHPALYARHTHPAPSASPTHPAPRRRQADRAWDPAAGRRESPRERRRPA